MDKSSTHYQSHLERISDYLILGPGVWWKACSGGVEFLDGSHELHYKETGPQLNHFRSKSMPNIELDLIHQWESICLSSGQLRIPATHIRYYNQQGNLQSLQTS